ncbi:MAG: hypothetical protein Ct9H300mP19_14590 [Dehalococcoidia bacterium]|nr:MAG: hypothetical protein Ct9H300mP19_14590 [Dehalococcoidia bacterium]
MITLGGAGPISVFGRDGFQEVDQVGVFEPISKAVMRPTDPARYPEQYPLRSGYPLPAGPVLFKRGL